VEKSEGFTRKNEDGREADFRLEQTALRGPLEVFDLAHPAGQWVPSGENLGHHPAKSLILNDLSVQPNLPSIVVSPVTW
jgi:hypothetical protein